MKKMSLAAVIAAVALSVSACGGGTATNVSTSTGTTSGDTSTSGSSTSSEPGGSGLGNVKVGDEVDGAAFATSVGEVYKEGQSGHFTMDMGGGMGAKGDFVVVDGKQNTHMTMSLGGLDMEVITIGGTSYTKGLAGDKWVKTATSDLGASAGVPNSSSVDPEKLAEAMTGMTMKVTKVTGDQVTYSVDLDLAKMMAASGMTTAPAGLPTSIPVTYTLDGDNRPLEISMNMGLELSVKYSDWGKKVVIEAPPSSEVTTK